MLALLLKERIIITARGRYTKARIMAVYTKKNFR
jgi:hypothetical protein